MDEEDSSRLTMSRGDMSVLSAVIAFTRRLLTLETIRPSEVVGLGRALYALQRLPDLTPGVMVDYAISLGGEEGSQYWGVMISDSALEVKSGGSDCYSPYSLELNESGYRYSEGDFDEWLAGAE